ncbi:MAG TPA: PIN domain nuclease, partial [Methanosarcinales archaeon]|nr:PIN domain nuclease [Methanosarcinales archaeon]
MQLIDFAEDSAFIDTNIFLYRYSNASLSGICEDFLLRVQNGELIGLVNSTVLNELLH